MAQHQGSVEGASVRLVRIALSLPCFAVVSTLGGCGSSSSSSNASGSSATPTPTAAATVAPTTTTTLTATVEGSATTAGAPTTLAHSSDTGPPPAGAIEEDMKNSRYSVTAINAKAGQLVVHLVNQEELSVRHDMIVGDALGHRFASSDRVTPGHDLVFTVDDLPAGTYNFWCSIDKHAALGMKGTITVTAT